MRPELAAVIPCADPQYAGQAGGRNADARRLLDGRQVETVHDDLVNGVGPLRQGGLHEPAQGRTVSIVGTGPQLLVPAADLAAAADDAAGKRQNDAGYLTYRRDGSLRCLQRDRLSFADDQEVAASHAFDRAEDVLAEELTVHD